MPHGGNEGQRSKRVKAIGMKRGRAMVPDA